MSLDPCEEVGSWEPSRNNRLTGDLSPSLRPGKRAHNSPHSHPDPSFNVAHTKMWPSCQLDHLHFIAIGRFWGLSVVGVCKRVMAMAKS